MAYSNAVPHGYSYEEKDYLHEVQVPDGIANPKFKISLSTLLFPYYLGKACVYAYRFKKLKKDDIKGHVKLTKKCKRCSKKLGFKVKMEDYIDDICWSLEEKTGYSLSAANKDLKKRFKCKPKRKGFELDIDEDDDDDDDNEEDDIDFNNIVERRIMEIVETKGGITQEEYLECLRLDPEINIDDMISPQSHVQTIEHMSCILRAKYTGFDTHSFYAKEDNSSDKHELKDISFELTCYVSAACVGGFLAMIPVPPINVIGGWMFGTAMTAAGTIIFHQYCEKRENGDFDGDVDWSFLTN